MKDEKIEVNETVEEEKEMVILNFFSRDFSVSNT